MANLNGKTKAPTGTGISRNGYKFACKWDIGDADYGEGQTFQYKIGEAGAWTGVKVGKKDTKVNLDLASKIPAECKYVQFRVRGKRKSYVASTKTTGKGKKKLTMQIMAFPTVSDWAYATFTIQPPRKPGLSASLDSTLAKTTFSWSVKGDDGKSDPGASDSMWYTGFEWQSILLRDSNITDTKALEPYFKSTTSGWASGNGTAASGSWPKAEDTFPIATSSYTRWFRVRSKGIQSDPGADKGWVYQKHVYAASKQAVVTGVSGTANSAGGTNVTVSYTSESTASRPIDSTTVQYVIVTPAVNASGQLICPTGATGWQNISVSQIDINSRGAITSSIDASPGLDQCMFVRVNTRHDHETTEGTPALAKVGTLKAPSSLSITNVVTATHRVDVSAPNPSDVPGSFVAITFQSKSIPRFVIGIIPNGQSSISGLQCPDWGQEDYRFTAQVVQGTYTATTRADGIPSYAVKPNMTSSVLEYGGTVPKPPASITVSRTDIPGTIRVTWTWTWNGADTAELSWSDREDAWESTDEPASYQVGNTHASQWNIAGLETGKVWYVRMRLGMSNGDNKTWSDYSEAYSINLASAPAIPALDVQPPVVTKDGTILASWGYVSNDGTPQAQATLAVVTGTAQSPVYTEIVRTQTAQHVSLSVARLGWTAGNTYGLAVKVASASGQDSDGWSDTFYVDVAEPLTAAITQSSLLQQTVDGRTYMALTSMPLTLTVTGAGVNGQTIVAIERTKPYHIYRPDESEIDGYDKETIAVWTQQGQAQITIDNENLIGRLDDSASYRIVATVKDSLGQTDSTSLDFEVHWSHQAIIPEATVVIDESAMIAILTPIAPAGVATGDTCDIYRLSVDKPVMIYRGATFGVKYVDPFPTIGEWGGYRFVFRTKDGDYITEDNELAWVDIYDTFEDEDNNIIDFGDGRVVLTRNISLSSSWSKDFQETKYLGGAVQGDWNPAVSRSTSLSAKALTLTDSETIQAMRRLAVHSGICHVRTKEGSNFTADVQVKEGFTNSTGFMVADFSMSITRVDPEELDGMSYEDWLESQARGQI